MADLTELQAAQTVKIAGANPSTGIEDNFLEIDSSGRITIAPLTNSSIIKSQLQDNAGNGLTSTLLSTKQALDVNIVNSTSSGVNDKTAFTYGTSNEQTIGGVYQDTSPGLTAGTTGAIRVTQNRGIHTNLRNSSGSEVSSSINDSVNNELLLGMKTPDTTTSTVALNALNATVSIPFEGLSSVGFQLLAGTLIGTIVPEVSIDGGTTWFATAFYDFSIGSVLTSVTFASANTVKLLTVITLGGTTDARIRVSVFTSGTANAKMSGSHGTGISISPSGAGGGSAAFGTSSTTFLTPPNNTITLLIAANTARKYCLVSNPTGSQLNMLFGSTGTGLTSSSGIIIPAKSFYEFKGDNLWTGNIYGFMSGGGQLTLIEGTP